MSRSNPQVTSFRTPLAPLAPGDGFQTPWILEQVLQATEVCLDGLIFDIRKKEQFVTKIISTDEDVTSLNLPVLTEMKRSSVAF